MAESSFSKNSLADRVFQFRYVSTGDEEEAESEEDEDVEEEEEGGDEAEANGEKGKLR